MDNKPNYARRLRKATREDLRSYWSAHRIWATFVSVAATFLPLAVQIVTHGARSVTKFYETVTSAAAGLIVSIGGNYLISTWRAAKTLDAGNREELTDLGKQIEKLTPKRSGSQEHHYNETKAALEQLGENERLLLKYLMNHEKVTLVAPPPTLSAAPSAQSSLPIGISVIDAYQSLEACVTKSLVSREYRDVTISLNPLYQNRYMDYRIAEGMKHALDELLYPPSEFLS